MLKRADRKGRLWLSTPVRNLIKPCHAQQAWNSPGSTLSCMSVQFSPPLLPLNTSSGPSSPWNLHQNAHFLSGSDGCHRSDFLGRFLSPYAVEGGSLSLCVAALSEVFGSAEAVWLVEEQKRSCWACGARKRRLSTPTLTSITVVSRHRLSSGARPEQTIPSTMLAVDTCMS